MRVLVCGGRDFDDHLAYAWLERELNKFHQLHWIDVLIHGEAPGADTLAGVWAMEHGVEVESYAADWQMYGKSAGAIRNRRMLMEGNPGYVFAFPGGRGTSNMIGIARKAGLPVYDLNPSHIVAQGWDDVVELASGRSIT